MRYNPNIHHRRSIRLRGYDYTQEGAYFVTICTQNRECLFGNIVDNEMILNPCGEMIISWVKKIENKYAKIKITSHILMPNHFHAIIVNAPERERVGADLRVCPGDTETSTGTGGREICVCETCGGETGVCEKVGRETGVHEKGGHTGPPLHRVVQWFKTMTTNEYLRGIKTLNWKPFDKRLWQRNYYEHIIRNQSEYNRIDEYINNNPKMWENDKLWTK